MGRVEQTGTELKLVATAVTARDRPMAEVSFDGIVVLREGCVMDANARFAELSACPMAELIGMSIDPLLPSLATFDWRTAPPDEFVVLETTGHRRDGASYTAELRLRHTVIAGERLCYVAVRDVSGDRSAQSALREQQARLRAMVAEGALAEQRARRGTAREVHDAIGQTLAALKLRLNGLRNAAANATQLAIIGELEVMLDGAIGATRGILAQLVPPGIYDLGLEAALQWLLRNLRASHGLACRLESRGDCTDIDPGLRILMFQAAQTLLDNVIHHAQVNEATLVIESTEHTISVTVRDLGVGFECGPLVSAAPSDRLYGLISLRERLLSLGGDLTVVSGLGRGTMARASLPHVVHARPGEASERISPPR